MTTTTVTTQTALDAALATSGIDRIVIDGPADIWLAVRTDRTDVTLGVRGASNVGPVRGSASIRGVWDSASIRDVGGSASIRGVEGSASISGVRDSASISGVWGSASISGVWDSASIRGVGGSASISDVGGSASIRDVGGSASISGVRGGCAIVGVHDHAVLTGIGPHVSVHLYSAQATVDGGRIIDLTSLDLRDPGIWCDFHGVHVDDEGRAHLFKAVDNDLAAGHCFRRTVYQLDTEVFAPDWRDDHSCGGGLHISPRPVQARSYDPDATRFLEVVVPLADLRPIDATKAKVPAVRVLREVDIHGQPYEAAS